MKGRGPTALRWSSAPVLGRLGVARLGWGAIPNTELGKGTGGRPAGSAVAGRLRCSLVLCLRRSERPPVPEDAVPGRRGLEDAGEMVWNSRCTREDSSPTLSLSVAARGGAGAGEDRVADGPGDGTIVSIEEGEAGCRGEPSRCEVDSDRPRPPRAPMDLPRGRPIGRPVASSWTAPHLEPTFFRIALKRFCFLAWLGSRISGEQAKLTGKNDCAERIQLLGYVHSSDSAPFRRGGACRPSLSSLRLRT